MSAEVVKKRGRPKKIISDPVELEMPELKKSTKRAKSTKAAPNAIKPTATATATKKTPIAPTLSKPATMTPPTAKAASKPSAPTPPPSSKTESKQSTPLASKAPPKPPTKPEASKILEKVRELSAKSVPAPADSATSSKPSPTNISSKLASQSSKSSSTTLKTSAPSTTSPPISEKSIPTPRPSQILPAASKSPLKIPIAALNSEIVSNISSRAGARPNTGGPQKLPSNYRPVARKVTMAIVAMPILIVTSYVLYQRLVMGEDRKLLVKPGLTKVETPEEDAHGGSSSPT